MDCLYKGCTLHNCLLKSRTNYFFLSERKTTNRALSKSTAIQGAVLFCIGNDELCCSSTEDNGYSEGIEVDYSSLRSVSLAGFRQARYTPAVKNILVSDAFRWTFYVSKQFRLLGPPE